MIPVFFLEPTNRNKKYLRCYSKKPCTSRHGIHDAKIYVGEVTGNPISGMVTEEPSLNYPTHCQCGYEFTPDDIRMTFHRPIYKRYGSEEYMTLEEAPFGACYNAEYIANRIPKGQMGVGDDGMSLVIKTPGGEWWVDRRANNCTNPTDNQHHCWVRHGDPRILGSLHIDKNGYTCNAGAGSIVLGNYHAMCLNGYLREI